MSIDRKIQLPLLPLRDIVIFPSTVTTLYVGRGISIAALEEAIGQDKQVLLFTQKDPSTEVPKTEDLYKVGVLGTVLQMLHLPDGTIKVLVEALCRTQLQKIKKHKQHLLATGLTNQAEQDTEEEPDASGELLAIMRSVLDQFTQHVETNRKIPNEVIVSLQQITQAGRLADCIASHVEFSIEQRQDLLSTYDPVERIEKLHVLINQQTDLAEVEQRIQGRVKKQVEKSQRQYYLSEKMKAIQKEMGDEDGNSYDENQALEKKIEAAGMSEEAYQKAINELNKLKMMPAMSAEATVLRNYIEWLTDVPWQEKQPINKDLQQAEEVLEKDHYGLEKVKKRILEYLAVQGRVDKLKGPILCLVGAPGVGKTSLGQSIANATGRKFTRFSLGGVRDEAEIRGHRRTYIGALPGKILQRMAKVKCKNPLFMLDEVDKMAMDFRGDPASALLEVLDPEQNNTFNDHYLEVDYDLSDVMFIATSNSLNIPPALLDRMEIIRLAGYTEQEKLHIAKNYLILRQIKQNGLKKSEISISDTAVRDIIRYYTREAGVRGLEREIAKICRKVVHDITLDKNKKKTKKRAITSKSLEEYLGVKKFRFGLAEASNQVGQVTGLAWTEVGGDLLSLEAQYYPGKGKSHFTGSLGDVMQESIQAAMTVVQTRASKLNIDPEFFMQHDFHVHVPEGATPKDGPSAGIGMCTALLSSITKIPVRSNVAMTGEITLRGEVLPIGGLKEKLLAALRGGIQHVIIPDENKRDLKEIPEEVKSELSIHPVRWIDEVWNLALEKSPEGKTPQAKRTKIAPVPPNKKRSTRARSGAKTSGKR